ncbi:MAG: anti-sigma factor antagonist [Clostridia bacterium]|nr:anti-sigma factor antagonist [Clostridia bacterium]
MVIRMDVSPQVITVWLSGELDHHAAHSLREQVDAAIERSVAKVLRLDFSGVTFMDSSGIGLIMGRYRLMTARGGRLLVVGASERLLRVMKLAGLEKLPVWERAQQTATPTVRKTAYRRKQKREVTK